MFLFPNLTYVYTYIYIYMLPQKWTFPNQLVRFPCGKSLRKSLRRNSFVASRLVWWMPSKPWMSRKMALSARFGLVPDGIWVILVWGLKPKSWFTTPATHVRIETKTCWKLVSSYYKCWGGLFVTKRLCFEKVATLVLAGMSTNTWVRWHRAWYSKGLYLCCVCQGDVPSSRTCFRFSCFHKDVSSNKPSNLPKKKYDSCLFSLKHMCKPLDFVPPKLTCFLMLSWFFPYFVC